MVFNYDTLTNNSELFGTSTGRMIDVGSFSQSERLRLRQDADNIYSGTGTLPLGDHILAIQADANGTRAWSSAGLLFDAPGLFQHYTLNGVNLGIGGAFFDGREFIGDLAELLVYDRALNPAEINAIGSYLGSKYSLAFALVPEPSRALLLLLGLPLLLSRRRWP